MGCHSLSLYIRLATKDKNTFFLLNNFAHFYVIDYFSEILDFRNEELLK